MKILLLTYFMLISSQVLAWDCYTYGKYNQPIEKHLQMASDILVGTVIEGKLLDASSPESEIKLKFKITLPIKGNLRKETELLTSTYVPNPRFNIGGNYIIFLYGTKNIDFCNMLIKLWTPVESKEDLNEYSTRKDVKGIERVAAVVKYLEQNP